jgi:hypothetical protein
MTNYRIFISYSHEDQKIAENVVALLEQFKLTPMWDRKFAFGAGFPEDIKRFIAHAHIFLPIITQSASKRGWVHQEIGYAMALNVPVLPIAVDALPGGMIQQLHAVRTDKKLIKLKKHLSREVFDKLIKRFQDSQLAKYQSADLTEDRATLLKQYSNDILNMGYAGCVRQRGALSSFHIPDKIIRDRIWEQRYGEIKKSEHHCRLQRDERLVMEKHAREKGCKLIINPTISYGIYGPSARAVRIQTLIEFLESMPNEKAKIAINTKIQDEENLIIVGDWFSAESVSGTIGRGYRQTIFTRHAPSMEIKIGLFEQEFKSLLEDNKWNEETSRVQAIQELKNIKKNIKVRN